MKLVIAQMKHETNTFSPVPTPLARFAVGGGAPPEGDAARAAYAGTGSAIAAFIELADAAGAEVAIPIAASAWPSGPVEDAQVAWDRSAVEIDRLVRACQPNPGAWTTFRGERFKITSGTPVPQQAQDAAELAPGELWVGRREVHVGTADGPLQLGQVQAQGKRPMAAADWARGLGSTEGLRMGD